ncbi:hypothetical protein EIB18_18070 [Caulobacter vibrioides]|uniref:Uncharacterized protein n=1 Tax=Caulobacter vibrioides (strain NA1000 / CB15N) TaxID=565050 RepID=A0A0H3CDB4_CAUVN|nr:MULTISPECIES: hypothetical protein [Caulobacter]YP_002518899.1 hypothetical protein CCNA_03526 [Caulobacter vibrioides NA1000]ACL96991.1 hypothetical protein CCNA_03526 [Caulobacter vibrioides NA1000]ATC26285.1 hypothetical protein CA608_17965 [Caulobacter vibrioides]ATC30235.1 hypothetical protein CA607_18325 [Caulobacter vibrioides]AZH14421.1 hypothetical protein EIB18_18070 [Caulobacter vibrioides]MCY1645715.1 hypothetical protein [Caulobacter sp. SL161]
MAYVSYDQAVHATAIRPQRRLAWGRLLALAATVGLWIGLIAAVRAIL